MQKPMLALPMGKDDWEKGERWDFLKSCAPILARLGWCIGIEAKGTDLEWSRECFAKILEQDGRITWHPPQSATRKIQLGLDENLAKIAEQVATRCLSGLEAVTIHCAPAISIDPPENAGLERYFSSISAQEMLEHIKAQVEPLRKLNKLMGGMLHIENPDTIQFRGGGCRAPTYLALQTGCFLDLLWLKEQAGLKTTFDCEHFLCASNLLQRRGQDDFLTLPTIAAPMEEVENELSAVTGYRLKKGWPPEAIKKLGLEDYIKAVDPRLFHLGGANQAVDSLDRITTHQPIDANMLSNPALRDILDFQLQWINEHPAVIGAVIEVTGKLKPEKYSEWSPRPDDDDIAKMQTYLTVIGEIENLQKRG